MKISEKQKFTLIGLGIVLFFGALYCLFPKQTVTDIRDNGKQVTYVQCLCYGKEEQNPISIGGLGVPAGAKCTGVLYSCRSQLGLQR